MTTIHKKFKQWWNDKKKKRLLENYTSLALLQGANYVLPLINLPYLVRVLGVEKFGLVMFANAFIQYFVVLTDYGFNLSTTHDIAVNRDRKDVITSIFSSVLIIKTGLLLTGILILLAVTSTFESLKENSLLYLATYGIVVGQTFFPVWFFQGMEKMKYITFLNISAKLIFTVLIFVFIHGQGDFLLVPILNSAGYIAAAVISLLVVRYQFQIRFRIPSIAAIKEQFSGSFLFFLSRVSVSLYTNSNVFVLGLFTGNITVGYYSAAAQVYRALQGIFLPLTNALYPFVSKEKNVPLFKKIFWASMTLILLVAVTSCIFSGTISRLAFGPGFTESANLLKLFSILVVISVASMLLGYPFLAALGFSKNANMSVVYGSILHFIMLIIIIPFMNIYLVASITIVTEAFVLMTRILAIRKHNLWSRT